MSTNRTRGKCIFCENDYSGAGMTRHLQACRARKQAIAAEKTKGAPEKKLFHIVVKGTYNPVFWLHLQVPSDATLYDLDHFLRDIWLECCGHLSMFEIGGTRYQSTLFDDLWDDDPTMDVKLARVLAPGVEFAHQYDFGSTTHLSLRVVAERIGVANKDAPVRILARNYLPDFWCAECGEPATVVCVWRDYTLLCDKCLETSGYGDEGLLPVVNSPRMGVCGYTGGVW